MISIKDFLPTKKMPIWPKIILVVFFVFAFLRNYIANDVPLYVKVDNHHYFPVCSKDMQSAGTDSSNYPWQSKHADYIIMPIIPYHANTLDVNNIHYKSPLAQQNIKSWRYRHFLGTDQLGRDVLARIIHGSSTALRIAFLSSIIALFLGLIFGILAGFYQDDGLKMSLWSIILWGIGIMLLYYILYYQNSYILRHGELMIWLFYLVLAVIGIWFLYFVDNKLISGIKARKYSIPFDLVIMRGLEVYKSIPFLLLLFTILVMFEKPTLTLVIWVIGFTRWTTITRYIRAELFHIRSQEYIKAAVSLGMNDWKIILRHALPNAISPIVVTVAFSMSSAILLESTLSFLGIGIPGDTISWGGLIQSARNATQAWWVAVFPGLAIFLLVLSFNRIAEWINDEK